MAFDEKMHGNTFILGTLNRFSKWTQMASLRKAKIEALHKAIRKWFVSRYRIPKVMVTDNGIQFNSRSFKRFLEGLGERHKFTAPYTPLENPKKRATISYS